MGWALHSLTAGFARSEADISKMRGNYLFNLGSPIGLLYIFFINSGVFNIILSISMAYHLKFAAQGGSVK